MVSIVKAYELKLLTYLQQAEHSADESKIVHHRQKQLVRMAHSLVSLRIVLKIYILLWGRFCCRHGFPGAQRNDPFENDYEANLSNASEVNEDGIKSHPIQQKQSNFRPLSIAQHAFVLFNTYRHSLQTFYVIGSTSVLVRGYENEPPVYSCEWVPSHGSQLDFEKSVTVDAQMLYIGFDENSGTYVLAVVNCTFDQTVGADKAGGILRLNVSKGHCFESPCGVVETVFEEQPGSVNADFLDGMDESKLQREFTFCGPRLRRGGLRTAWIPMWLAYHNFLWHGSAHFYLYDIGEIGDAELETFAPWIKAGLPTIIDARGEEMYPVYSSNQIVFLNDCLYRTRFTSRWVMFHDLDEFLHISAPHTLNSLLEQNADAPWMSFASLPVSLEHCRENCSADDHESLWPLERMLWSAPQPTCKREKLDPWLCVSHIGRRKILVNPRKVMLVGVHRTAMPASVPAGGGIDLNGRIGRLRHYRGGANPRMELCTKLVSNGSEPHDFQFDDSMASLVPSIRNYTDYVLSQST